MAEDTAKRILVVDDVTAVRRLVCAMLRQSGFEVLEAGCGAEALRILEASAHRVHLILTDVIMPEMDGPELADRVAAHYPGTPVIFMSGYAGDDLLPQAPRRAHGFLPKPFTATALDTIVRRALESSEAD